MGTLGQRGLASPMSETKERTSGAKWKLSSFSGSSQERPLIVKFKTSP